ncbi:MAG: PilC/PilY family type IV pilus protein, partial [Burkholderiales bacterium]|nr:PilC/PilY family type IV pilus protein [Burkholderiales bacterium]
WHAALNSRGRFYPVERAEEIIEALEDIANRIERRIAASASVAANSTRLDTDTEVYLASFTAAEWTGALRAYRLEPTGALGGLLWTASIPAHNARLLVTHDGSQAVPFNDVALLPGDWASQVGVAGATAAEVLAYLRGDQRHEQRFNEAGVLIGGKYRKRNALLGDIVNSDPVYAGHQDYGYNVLPEGGASYTSFVQAKKNRVKMIYIGANDGMLHGFAAGGGTGSGNTCGDTLGKELFAYIPRTARLHMPVLANPQYGQQGGIAHRFLVDGPPYVGDAYIGGSWKTILLATTGAGGRTIFALDVTNPCEFGPSKVLWERDEQWDNDLGHMLHKPIIARLNNGKWAAVFGNGYNSAQRKAVLFIVDLENGSLIKKFVLPNPSGVTDNGLAGASLYDANNDGVTDYVYAGDMAGRLWKFDVSANSAATWTVAYGTSDDPVPLFSATSASGTRQPITSAPELGRPPSGVNGVMVYFGTGRFFASGDEADRNVQSVYGLLDNHLSAITGRDQLVAQTITEESAVHGTTVRRSSRNLVDYAHKRGWYLDLNYGGNRGERVLSTPRRIFKRVLFTSIVPEQDPCNFGGRSWLLEFDPHEGSMPEQGLFIVGDQAVSAIQTNVGLIDTFEFLWQGDKAIAVGYGSKAQTATIHMSVPPQGMRTGRVSWREIIQ